MVPNSDRVFSALISLEFTDDAQEYEVSVPVEEIFDVSFHVELERGYVLIDVLVIDEHFPLG